ncbi:MAG: lysophospholipid acyltransferase family protein [Deltaproteobacteria bacterium]|nr:lysophospholipid acyltransferase family protein [Deltaproteobacteria bacterium]MCL5276656.1 lysophospholipid acyltransferase family protein [Deltaproteobacteria bacterium]
MIKKARYFLEYVFLRAVVFFLNMLSDNAIRRVASAAGFLWYGIDTKRRGVARRNIDYAFPEMSDDEKKGILRDSYKNIIETFIAFPRISRFNSENIKDIFEFQCEEYYEEALKRGKGVFLLTGHHGNWEFAAAAHSIKHGGMVAVAKDIHNPYINAYIKALRRGVGMDVVRPRNAVFKLMRSLKQGRTIAMLLDQNTLKHEAVFVKFFGRPAATQYAMALMALKTGAAVVPGYIVRGRNGKGYVIRYERPIFVEDGGDKERAIVEWTQHFTSVLEAHIRMAPAQWFWVHDRFKTKPGPDGRGPHFPPQGGRA